MLFLNASPQNLVPNLEISRRKYAPTPFYWRAYKAVICLTCLQITCHVGYACKW